MVPHTQPPLKEALTDFFLVSLDMVVVNVVHNASKEQQLLFLEFRRDLEMGLLTRTFTRGCRSYGVPKKV